MWKYYSNEQDLLLISTLQKENKMIQVGSSTSRGQNDVMYSEVSVGGL